MRLRSKKRSTLSEDRVLVPITSEAEAIFLHLVPAGYLLDTPSNRNWMMIMANLHNRTMYVEPEKEGSNG